ncbi:MAG: PTS sugar transporter subunit IIC, partial [Coprobacillus sp.]
MLTNALIVGIVLAFTKFFDWYGNTMFQRPIFCVSILGALLGHPVEGVILAAQLELVFLGNVSLGGVMPTDFTLGSIFGAAFALLLGKD